MKEYQMINRTAITIKYKKPYLDWIQSIERDTQILGYLVSEKMEYNVYLIPEYDCPDDSGKYIEKIYNRIFEHELNGWYEDKTIWPKDRTLDMFKQWFSWEINTVAYDTVNKEIKKE